jgi:hypothetical protein
VNLTKIYCNQICKYHNVAPVQLLYANKNLIIYNHMQTLKRRNYKHLKDPAIQKWLKTPAYIYTLSITQLLCSLTEQPQLHSWIMRNNDEQY